MKKIFLAVIGIAFFAFSGLAQDPGGEMNGLAKIRKGVKSKRISSYDRTGGNGDRLTGINTGEKATIFDVKGAGIINHIWITISPQPERMSRNDIILRMYWDGNDYPSVESPIGPFFGQGWNERYNFSSLPLSAGPGNGTGLVSYFSMQIGRASCRERV